MQDAQGRHILALLDLPQQRLGRRAEPHLQRLLQQVPHALEQSLLLTLLEPLDEVAIVAAPGFTDAEHHESLIAHCEHPLRQDRVAILDAPEQVTDVSGLTRVATAGQPPKPDHGKDGKEEDAGGDGTEGSSPAESPASPASPGSSGSPASPAPSPDTRRQQSAYRPRQSDYAAFYYPWIVVRDPVSGSLVSTPPSGHLAGVWARTDATRGVHKAPANEPVVGAVDLVRRVSRGEQELLNPAGVNCIRYFPGEGIRVWGARTLAAEADPFRYINVRRLTNMLKESIAVGTRWIVFEPNDYTLWASIRRDINAFLTNVWRDGALLGRTPQEAFFVACDAETNPPEVRDAGQVVTVIGIAPVKPAEFVIFRLMQSADAIEIQGPGA